MSYRPALKTLDKVINEVKELTIYEGSANFLTRNDPNRLYFQGQLNVTKHIPNPFVPLTSVITVSVAPPEVKDPSAIDSSRTDVQIRSYPSISVIIGNNCL